MIVDGTCTLGFGFTLVDDVVSCACAMMGVGWRERQEKRDVREREK